MSAFVVSHETINAVVSAFHPLNEGFVPCEQSDELGRQLWAMNVAAVNQRYSEENEPDERFHYRPHHYSKFELLKAAQCLRYQCSEGNVPEWQLYGRLEKLCFSLMYEIIAEIPEYNAAAWNLPNHPKYQPDLIAVEG